MFTVVLWYKLAVFKLSMHKLRKYYYINIFFPPCANVSMKENKFRSFLVPCY